MNKIRNLAVLIVLFTATTAIADFQTKTLAHELEPSALRLPASTVGNLAFQECEDCDLTTLRVNANTRYLVNGESVDLRDIRAALLRARRASEVAPVIVLQNLETDIVVSVKIKL